MIEMLGQAGGGVDDDLTPTVLLASIQASRRRELAEAARQLDLAARWADLHPPESIHHAATFTVPGCEHEEPIAGPGTPHVAEFCVAELGTVLGMSTMAAKRLIGHALELRHRLPRLWTQVHTGQVPAWRARAVAEATIHATPALTVEAAAHVDAHVAAVAGRIGPAQLDRLVADTIQRFHLDDGAPDPTLDPIDGYLHVDPRHVTIHDQDVHFAGTIRIEAEVDLADATDLTRAVAHGAATQAALGSTLPLDARRAKALGDLARTQTALDLLTGTTGTDRASGPNPATRRPEASATPWSDGLPAAREVVLHAHLDLTLTDDAPVFGPTGHLEERQRLILLDHVRDWCADSRTKVTIKPVIDLNEGQETAGYVVPARIREHVILRDRTCVFPWCTRPARACDIDHVIPYDHNAEREGRPQPGPTATWNLAPLCRHHHRLKTHTAWRYEVIGRGAFVWTSPHGHHYRRDHTGTTAVDPPDHDSPRIPHPRRP